MYTNLLLLLYGLVVVEEERRVPFACANIYENIYEINKMTSNVAHTSWCTHIIAMELLRLKIYLHYGIV